MQNPAPAAVQAHSSLAACLLLAGAVFASPAQAAGPSTASAGSLGMAAGAASVVAGSPLLLVGEPSLTVEGIETLAQGLQITLKGTAQTAAEAATLVVLIPTGVAAGASVAVGKTVEVVASAGGYLLRSGGETLAYLAIESRRALLFSEPVTGSGCCPRCC